MKIGIISGSVRQESQSERIGHFIETRIKKLSPVPETDFFSLREINMPLWSEDQYDPDSTLFQKWVPLRARLKTCSSFVVISPEWSGMVPPHLKNFFLFCTKGELAHKPALIIGVSAGMGGTYPIAELRLNAHKNTYIWWLPDHIILRDVSNLFYKKDETSEKLTARIDYGLNFLHLTDQALKPVREKAQDLKNYPFGM